MNLCRTADVSEEYESCVGCNLTSSQYHYSTWWEAKKKIKKKME